MKNVHLDATSDIQEIKVLGEWACMRNHLTVRMTPPSGSPTVRYGYTLSILRKFLAAPG